MKPPSSRPKFGARGSFAADFLSGLSAPVSALIFLIRRPSLWRYSVIGALSGLVIFAGLGALAIPQADNLLGMIWARPEGQLSIVVWWVVVVLTALVSLAAVLAVSLVISAILMAPLYDSLSEKVERTILPPIEGARSTLGTFAFEAWQGASHSVLNLVIYGSLMVPVLALNVIPVLGSIASAALGFLLSATMFGLEFSDHPQSRRRFLWGEKVRLVRAEIPAFLGLGIGIAGLLLVPILDLLLVPVAVVAGTMVFCGLQEAGRVAFVDRRIAPLGPNVPAGGRRGDTTDGKSNSRVEP